MNPFLMSIGWFAMALWIKASGESEPKFIACIIMASIWAAAVEIIRKIRKTRS